MPQKRKRTASTNHRTDNTLTPAKRRRSDSRNRRPSSAASNGGQRATTSTDDASIERYQVEGKGKRRRPKTARIRRLLKDELERHLRTQPSPLAAYFTSCDEEGVPQADFELILPHLNCDREKISKLSPSALCSISHESDVFSIELSAEHKLMLKFTPLTFDPDDATVYVDNLPAAANKEKLHRLAALYGNVVSVKVPLKAARWVTKPNGTRIDVGSKPQKFAFVQFTEVAIAEEFCKAFSRNLPRDENESTLRQDTHQLAMEALKKKIRLLARKRYRRSLHESLKLSRLRRAFARMRKKEIQLMKLERGRLNGELPTPILTTATEVGIQPAGKSNEVLPTSSNNEMEMETPPPRKDSKKEVSFCENIENKKDEEGDEKQNRTRRRRKRRNRQSPAYVQGSLKEYFSAIQVFKLKDYRRMRTEYLRLKKTHQKEIVRLGMGRVKSTEDKNTSKKFTKRLEEYRDKMWKVLEENATKSE